MLNLNDDTLSFKTQKQVETYSKFFLRLNPIDSLQEFPSRTELKDFEIRRETQLKSQLDLLRNVDLSKANISRVENEYFKICKLSHKTPLGSIGSSIGSSRFNYKEISLLQNRTVYFGRTKKCCEIEKFHLHAQRELIKKTHENQITDDEIKFPPHLVKKYRIKIDKILILTTKPSMDAIGITPSAFMNEWYDINEEYEIPTSSQILGTIARTNGINGIMYNSVRHQIENNLVLFENNTGELQFEEIESQEYAPDADLLGSVTAT